MLKVILVLFFLMVAVGCSDPTDDYMDEVISDMQWLTSFRVRSFILHSGVSVLCFAYGQAPAH
jgi:hypothetical protein